jgi:hypothetical protein
MNVMDCNGLAARLLRRHIQSLRPDAAVAVAL